MSVRGFRIPVMPVVVFSLFLAAPLPQFAQSLGDVARQERAERQRCGVTHLKVYTNDDLVRSAPAPLGHGAKTGSSSAENGKSTASDTGSSAEAGKSAAGETASSSPAGDHERREKEIETRTLEINQVYLDKITALRTKINDAQNELVRIQRDQAESANLYRYSSGTSMPIAEFQQQQHFFGEQIDAQQKLIVSLKQQLDDAEESARHAGVPHVSE
jgi:hypothetical protein